MENQNNNTEHKTSPTVDMTAPAKSKLPVVIGSAAGVVAAAGIATACVFNFVPSARDWLDRKTSDPEEYFSDKEEKYIEDNAQALGDSISENLSQVNDVYDSFDLSKLSLSNIDELEIPAGAYTLTSGVEFDAKAIADFANDFANDFSKDNEFDPSDPQIAAALEAVSSIKSFSVGAGMISDGKGLISLNGKLGLNDNSILDTSIILDTNEKSIYVSIPSISSKYIKYTLSQSQIDAINDSLASMTSGSDDYDEFLEYMEMSNEVLELVADNLSTIVTDYYKVIVDGIKDDMSLEEDAPIEIAGSEFKVTEMKTELTQEDAKGIVKDILEQAKDDKNLLSIADTLGAKSEYEDAIEDLLDEIDDSSADSDETADFYAWTDKKGNVIGHKLVIGDIEFGYAAIESDNDTYASIWTAEDEQKISYDAILNGKSKSNGTMKLVVDINDGYAVIKADYNDYEIVDEKKGLFNVDVKITAEIEPAKSDDEIATVAEALKDFAIELKSECTDNSQEITYGLEYKDNSLLKVSVVGETLKDTDVNLPDNDLVIDVTDAGNPQELLEEYLESITLMTIKDNLKKAIDNTVISAGIDAIFESLGLNKIDGSQSADDVLEILDAIDHNRVSTEKVETYTEPKYDYGMYGDEDNNDFYAEYPIDPSQETF